MATQTTSGNLGLAQPEVGSTGWGPELNANSQIIDTAVTELQTPFKGAYNAGTIYNNGQIVTFGGDVYMSTQPNNINNTPGSSGAWQNLGGGGVTITPVALAPGAPGNFTVAHGLGVAPVSVVIEMKSGGQIWFQNPEYDGVNLYLVASDAGLIASAKCIV